MAQNTASIEVKGLKETIDKLERVSRRMRQTVARKAVVAAAKVVALQARRNAPRITGTLRRAIFWHYSSKRSKTDQVVVALVRARSGEKEASRRSKSGKRLANRDAFYAGWVEFGHRNVPRKGKGTSIGFRRRAAPTTSRTPPHPFLAPAYLATRHAALAALEQSMRDGLNEATPR